MNGCSSDESTPEPAGPGTDASAGTGGTGVDASPDTADLDSGPEGGQDASADGGLQFQDPATWTLDDIIQACSIGHVCGYDPYDQITARDLTCAKQFTDCEAWHKCASADLIGVCSIPSGTGKAEGQCEGDVSVQCWAGGNAPVKVVDCSVNGFTAIRRSPSASCPIAPRRRLAPRTVARETRTWPAKPATKPRPCALRAGRASRIQTGRCWAACRKDRLALSSPAGATATRPCTASGLRIGTPATLGRRRRRRMVGPFANPGGGVVYAAFCEE